jgi:hypothetical protein
VNEHDHCNNQANGLDLVPSDLGDTRILAPVAGTVGWVDDGCLGIDIPGTLVNLSLCHFDESAIYVTQGDAVVQGDVVGLRDPNDPWVHISLDARHKAGGGDIDPLSSAPSVPFDGAYALDGVSMTASQPAVPNEHRCGAIISTNPPRGDHAERPTVSQYAPAPTLDCSASSHSLSVEGNHPYWTDTGLVVQASERLHITATGEITWDPTVPEPTVGPDGASWTPSGVSNPSQFLLPDAPIASLIGKIGDSVFPIGSDRTVTAPASGELSLGMNERWMPGCWDDNSGSWQVTVEVVQP